MQHRRILIICILQGGQFFFMEHICADENAPGNVKLMQSILKRPLKWLFDCDLARTTHEIIRRASFSHVDMKLFDAVELLKPTPIIPFASWFVNAIRPHVLGVATK
jgi:hypothetical protein